MCPLCFFGEACSHSLGCMLVQRLPPQPLPQPPQQRQPLDGCPQQRLPLGLGQRHQQPQQLQLPSDLLLPSLPSASPPLVPCRHLCAGSLHSPNRRPSSRCSPRTLSKIVAVLRRGPQLEQPALPYSPQRRDQELQAAYNNAAAVLLQAFPCCRHQASENKNTQCGAGGGDLCAGGPRSRRSNSRPRSATVDPMPRTSAFGDGFDFKQILEIGEASFKDGCRPRVAHSKIK